uniref:Uncharacterized protein n=1 Tax=Trichogramma kaykai TaxID=54128 RepID=A0ABD2VVY4_9HYME
MIILLVAPQSYFTHSRAAPMSLLPNADLRCCRLWPGPGEKEKDHLPRKRDEREQQLIFKAIEKTEDIKSSRKSSALAYKAKSTHSLVTKEGEAAAATGEEDEEAIKELRKGTLYTADVVAVTTLSNLS